MNVRSTSLVKEIPNMSIANRRVPGGPYMYRSENDYGVTLAAIAEQQGLTARVQVATGLGGFADLVVSSGPVVLLLCELKLDLNTGSQLRRAAEQVLGYQRHIAAWSSAIVAPRVNESLRAEFESAYPSVELMDTPRFERRVATYWNSNEIALRAVNALDLAIRLATTFSADEVNVDLVTGLRAARSILHRRIDFEALSA